MNDKAFPTILIILAIGASVVYWTKGDWRKVGYWAAAAILTFCITY